MIGIECKHTSILAIVPLSASANPCWQRVHANERWLSRLRRSIVECIIDSGNVVVAIHGVGYFGRIGPPHVQYGAFVYAWSLNPIRDPFVDIPNHVGYAPFRQAIARRAR